MNTHRRPAAELRVLDTSGPYSRNGERDSMEKKIRDFRTVVCKNARRGAPMKFHATLVQEISPEIHSKCLLESNDAAFRR